MRKSICLTAMILMAMTIVACTKTQTTPTSIPTSGATPTATSTPTDTPATPTSTPTEVPATPTPTVTPTSEPTLTGALTGYKTTDQASVYVNKALNLTGVVEMAKFKDCIVVLTETEKSNNVYEYSLVTYSTSDYQKTNTAKLDTTAWISFLDNDWFIRCENAVLIIEQSEQGTLERSEQGTRFHRYNLDSNELSLVESANTFSDAFYDEANDRVILLGCKRADGKANYEFDSFDLKNGEIKKISDIKLDLDDSSGINPIGITDTDKYLFTALYYEGESLIDVYYSYKNHIVDINSGATSEAKLPVVIGEHVQDAYIAHGLCEPNGKRVLILDQSNRQLGRPDNQLYVYYQDTKKTINIQPEDIEEAYNLFNYGSDYWYKHNNTVDWENNILITFAGNSLRSYSLETGKLLSSVKISFSYKCLPFIDLEDHLMYVPSGANGLYAWDYLNAPNPKEAFLSKLEPTDQEGVYTTSKIPLSPGNISDYDKYRVIRFKDSLISVLETIDGLELCAYDSADLSRLNTISIAPANGSFCTFSILDDDYILVAEHRVNGNEKMTVHLYDEKLNKDREITLPESDISGYDKTEYMLILTGSYATVYSYSLRDETLTKLFSDEKMVNKPENYHFGLYAVDITDMSAMMVMVEGAAVDVPIPVFAQFYKINAYTGKVTLLSESPYPFYPGEASTDAELVVYYFEPDGNRSVYSRNGRIHVLDAEGKETLCLELSYAEGLKYDVDWKNNVIISYESPIDSQIYRFSCYSMKTGEVLSTCDMDFNYFRDEAYLDQENGLMYLRGSVKSNADSGEEVLVVWDYMK